MDDDTEADWLKWCRLCAKRDLNEKESRPIFVPNEDGKFCSVLASSIDKYFCVNIKAEDEISQCVCWECRQLIEELDAFTEHVNKVQMYFCSLQNVKPTAVDQVFKLRSQSGLVNDQWQHHRLSLLVCGQHIIKLKKEKVQEPSTSMLINKEIQTDFKNNTEYERDLFYNAQTSSETEEYESETETESDNELEAECQDSLQTSHQEYEEDMEHSFEMLEEEGDGEEYVTLGETKNETLELLKGKRRRLLSASNLKADASFYHLDCRVCKRRYKNNFRKAKSSIHQKISDNMPDSKSKCYTCSVCSREFLKRRNLKLHMICHLPDKDKYQVPCPHCDRKFTRVAIMKQHVKSIHYQIKPFICDQCGRACTTKTALTEHQLVHTNECPFECEVCHKRFKNKPRLKSHLETHNKSKYKCPDCGLELKSKRYLFYHRQLHSDVKRFNCEICDAAFKTSLSLKRHLLLHWDLKPYKCNFCSKAFSNSSNCRTHKKRAHPKELAEEEANGKQAERVLIPQLEELKSTKGALGQSRKIKRNVGGLNNQLQKRLESCNKSEIENTNDRGDAGENDQSNNKK